MHCCHHHSWTCFVNAGGLSIMALNGQTQRFGARFMSALADRQSRCVRRSYLWSSTYGESGDTWQLEYGRSAPICAWHGTKEVCSHIVCRNWSCGGMMWICEACADRRCREPPICNSCRAATPAQLWVVGSRILAEAQMSRTCCRLSSLIYGMTVFLFVLTL